MSDLELLAKHCTTHHHACDCREAMFKARIAELEHKNAALYHSLDIQMRCSKKDMARIDAMEQVIMDAWGFFMHDKEDELQDLLYQEVLRIEGRTCR